MVLDFLASKGATLLSNIYIFTWWVSCAWNAFDEIHQRKCFLFLNERHNGYVVRDLFLWSIFLSPMGHCSIASVKEYWIHNWPLVIAVFLVVTWCTCLYINKPVFCFKILTILFNVKNTTKKQNKLMLALCVKVWLQSSTIMTLSLDDWCFVALQSRFDNTSKTSFRALTYDEVNIAFGNGQLVA